MHACAIMSVCLCMCIRVLLMNIYKTTLCIVVLLINVVLLVVKCVDILCETNVVMLQIKFIMWLALIPKWIVVLITSSV